MNFSRKAVVATGVTLTAGLFAGLASTAHAAVPTSATASTIVQNRPDSGNGGTWGYDSFKRTLTVTLAATQKPADTAAGLVDYTATVSDSGYFNTVGGAGTPNQFVPGTKILHNGVKGSMSGGISYTVTAPSADTLTGTVPGNENDNFSTTGSGFVSTGNWPKLAFETATGVTVTENSDWSWTYKTGCETWVDSAANGDGNTSNDGNITGKICAVPYVYAGHGITVNNNSASVGWSESQLGWPDPSAKCEQVWISGYGFGAWNGSNPGTAHVGYTCDRNGSNTNVGYLWGLAAGHTYALRIVPSTTEDWGHRADATPIPGAHVGYVDVFTTR